MRLKIRKGHSIVSFALIVPVLTLLLVASLDLTFLALQQFKLEKVCAEVARDLAISPYLALDDLRGLALDKLKQLHMRDVSVGVRPVFIPILTRPFPSNNQPLVAIELKLERRVSPKFALSRILGHHFRLSSLRREVRL